MMEAGDRLGCLAGKCILVTGLTSFVASGLLPQLVQARAHVIATDTNVGWRPWIAKLVEQKRIEFVNADVLTEVGLEALRPRFVDVDCIIHLARKWAEGATPLQVCVDEVTTNLLGSVRFLANACQRVKKVIYPSTVEVYGSSESLPLKENHKISPASPYAVAKSAAEGFLRTQAVQENLELCILRLSTIYGPGELEPRAVPNFVRAALQKEELVIDGSGTDIRDYVNISDVACATLTAVHKLRRGVQVFNIGTGVGCSTVDLARQVIRLTGGKHNLRFRPNNRVPSKVICDVTAARDQLGFVAQISLEKGLAAEIQWFRDNPAFWRTS